MRTRIPVPLLLACACACFLSAAHAQTYYYIDDIFVAPSSPTDQDNIELQLVGNLSNTGSSVVSATATVDGYDLDINVVAQSSGGLQVLVPHTEFFQVGPLSAGTYTITVSGSSVGDFAPASAHVFNVVGGGSSPCDPLVIAGVQWSAFSETSLVVHVFNPTSELFNYPGFVLLADNGDTLAQETVDFFGIGAENWHTLAVHSGATIPTGTFTGTLYLWTGFYSEQACAWELTFDLCPPEPCSELYPTVQNVGSGTTVGSFSYQILDEDVPVASGTLLLGEDQYVDRDTICLPPGQYILSLSADQPANAGQPFFSIEAPGFLQGPTAPVDPNSPTALPFGFYTPCIELPQGIHENPSAGFHVTNTAAQVTLSRMDGAALGFLRVYDAQGRSVANVVEGNSVHVFPVSNWSPGLYICRVVGADEMNTTLRWVVY